MRLPKDDSRGEGMGGTARDSVANRPTHEEQFNETAGIYSQL